MKINIGKIVTGFLAFFMAIIEFVLVFRFALKLFAASSTAEFTTTIYNTSDPLIAPFEGVFPSFEVGSFSLETSTLLAMLVYAIVGVIFYMLARNIGGVSIKQGQTSTQPLISPDQNPQLYQPPVQQPIQQTPTYQQPTYTQQPQQPTQPTNSYNPPMVQQPEASSTPNPPGQTSTSNPPTNTPQNPPNTQ